VDWLRTKGLAAAAKKAGRTAAEGLIGVAVEGSRGAIVEVNSETDFVARNENFQQFVAEVAQIALAQNGDLDRVKAAAYPGTGRTVEEELTNLIATIGENMSLRRAAAVSVDKGIVASYVHNQIAPGLGKIGVLVALETGAAGDKVADMGKQLAMHVAAAAPQAIDRAGVSAESLARERDVLSEQARESGKPENIIEKMVEGRLRKFYEEACLLEQVFVIDGESRVSDVVDKAGGEVGAPVVIAAFVRFALGEGIDKGEDDFAAEVAQLAG